MNSWTWGSDAWHVVHVAAMRGKSLPLRFLLTAGYPEMLPCSHCRKSSVEFVAAIAKTMGIRDFFPAHSAPTSGGASDGDSEFLSDSDAEDDDAAGASKARTKSVRDMQCGHWFLFTWLLHNRVNAKVKARKIPLASALRRWKLLSCDEGALLGAAARLLRIVRANHDQRVRELVRADRGRTRDSASSASWTEAEAEAHIRRLESKFEQALAHIVGGPDARRRLRMYEVPCDVADVCRATSCAKGDLCL